MTSLQNSAFRCTCPLGFHPLPSQVDVSCKDSSVLPTDSPPVHLLFRPLSQLGDCAIININNLRYLLPAPPDVLENDIILSPLPSMCPVIKLQASPLMYHRPNFFSLTDFLWQVADTNFSAVSQWLLQAHYVHNTFDY